MSEPKVLDLTPTFVYTEPVEIVAEFINDLSRAWALPEADERYLAIIEVVDGTRANTKGIGVMGARERMREILTQDIELQIANKTFPLPKRVR